MGLRDKVLGQPSERDLALASSSEGFHYDAEVNKGRIGMGGFTAKLNQRWANGWRLDKVFEQDGNTVMVWERRS